MGDPGEGGLEGCEELRPMYLEWPNDSPEREISSEIRLL